MDENRTAFLRILVVDDDESALTAIGSILRADGSVVLAAKSGREGLVIAARERPDVILLDAQMPGMDGFEMARALGATERTNGIPVMIVTSLTGQENRLRALKAGAVDLLSKPVEPTELLAKVTSLARLKAYNDEMAHRQAALSLSLAGSEGQLKSTIEAYA